MVEGFLWDFAVKPFLSGCRLRHFAFEGEALARTLQSPPSTSAQASKHGQSLKRKKSGKHDSGCPELNAGLTTSVTWVPQ
jgi:hypothetical protein